MFTIKRAAALIGVTEGTLRAWERRYGVVQPKRTPSGYRMYDADAVRVLMAMKNLIDSGWAVRAAAEQAAGLDSARGASGEGSAPLPALEDHDALLGPARSLDAAELSALLDQHFARAAFETVVDHWLLPSLKRVGEAWETGELSVAGEHFVSAAVNRRLAAAYDAAGDNALGPRVALGLPPEDRHDLGLLSFAVAARRVGLATRYLGADVPVRAWKHAVEPGEISCALLAMPTLRTAAAVPAVVDAIETVRPGLIIAVGGAHQGLAPDRCIQLGHQIGPGAIALAELLSPSPASQT